MRIMEDVFRAMLNKKFDAETEEFIDIIVNVDKGDFEIYHNRVVVDDDDLEDPLRQIKLSDAVKIEPDFEVDGRAPGHPRHGRLRPVGQSRRPGRRPGGRVHPRQPRLAAPGEGARGGRAHGRGVHDRQPFDSSMPFIRLRR